MKPVLASTIKDELNRPVPITKAGAKRARTSGENGSNGTLAEGDSVSPEGAPANAHHSVLVTLLAKNVQVHSGIVDSDGGHVLAVLDAVGAEQTAMVGHSIGGFYVMRMAVEAPEVSVNEKRIWRGALWRS